VEVSLLFESDEDAKSTLRAFAKMLASTPARKNDLSLYLHQSTLFFSPSSAQMSVEEFLDIRPVVAMVIDVVDADVVLQDIIGHVGGIVNNSNLCSANKRHYRT
jgi:hypothetical protein